jgi:hypothetical protein
METSIVQGYLYRPLLAGRVSGLHKRLTVPNTSPE